MEFRKVLALRGPNIWASFPILEVWIDLGDLKDCSSEELPGFNERLMSWLPTMIEHRCSVGERGGFFQRLERGTYLAHILEHVTLELQSLAGSAVGFGRTRETSREGVYKVAIEFQEEELARACLEVARDLCLAAVHHWPCDVPTQMRRLRDLARRLVPTPAMAALARAARRRRIPLRRLNTDGLIQLGHGARQRRLLAGQTDRTSALAESIAHDGEVTRSLLQAVGVPVPSGRLVAGAEDAWAAAQDLGLPVVVKPRYGSLPQGIEPRWTREEVLAAHAAVSQNHSSILVERFVHGTGWRLLVVGERVVAATRLQTGHDGSGQRPGTAGLTEHRNGDGRNGNHHALPGATVSLPLDKTTPGQDGSTVDLLARVHPEVAARAVEAARTIGLDVAGIDIVAEDLGCPLETQGGIVAAVSARPDVGHRPVAEAILAHLFPAGENGRVPIVAVTGVNGKTTVACLITHLLTATHRCVGMTSTQGIYVGGRRIDTGDCSGPWSARAVLQNPQVEAAVLETARGGILREGLGFDRCQVAVVTNIAEGDHLGLADIETPEQLARVKRTIVDAVADDGFAVLNADDPLVAAMAPHCPGAVVFFARDGQHPVLLQHRATGGRVVFVRDDHVILAEGERETPLVALAAVPLTHGGRIGFQVENALAAAAAAWCLDIPCPVLQSGLESFAADMDKVPGRFNVLEIRGATVILDYGHNTSSLMCLIDAFKAVPHRRRSVVYTAAGDRRDSDLLRQGELLGDAFDRVILYEEEHCIRGRKQGEITALFRQGLAGRARVREIEEVRGAVHAAEVALNSVRPGELLLIQVDLIDETVDLVKRLLSSGHVGREIGLQELLASPRRDSAARHAMPGSSGLEIRDCPLGKGVYAAQPLPKGQLLLRARGTDVPVRTRHSFQIDVDRHILLPPPTPLINHSCEPNCGVLVRRASAELEIHALKRIEAGEELTIDYATFEYEIQFLTGPCLCGAWSCRGSITGYKDLPAERRMAYGPYIAEYLQEMDALISREA